MVRKCIHQQLGQRLFVREGDHGRRVPVEMKDDVRCSTISGGGWKCVLYVGIRSGDNRGVVSEKLGVMRLVASLGKLAVLHVGPQGTVVGESEADCGGRSKGRRCVDFKHGCRGWGGDTGCRNGRRIGSCIDPAREGCGLRQIHSPSEVRCEVHREGGCRSEGGRGVGGGGGGRRGGGGGGA